MTSYDAHAEAEEQATPDELADLLLRVDAEAADYRAWLADMAERDAAEVEEYEANIKRRTT